MTVQQYQAQLDEHKQAAFKCNDNTSKIKLQESSLRDIIAAILSLSICQVRQSNTVTVDYLFLTACVDRKNVSLSLLNAASIQAREDTVKVLKQYALITRRPTESALNVHRLIHYALRKRLQAERRLKE
jgi:hypothetical protein